MSNFIYSPSSDIIFNTDKIACIYEEEYYTNVIQYTVCSYYECENQSRNTLDKVLLSFLPENFYLIDEIKYGSINEIYLENGHHYLPKWYKTKCWVNVNYIEKIQTNEIYQILQEPYIYKKVHSITLPNMCLMTTVDIKNFLPSKITDQIESQKMMYKLMYPGA